MGVVEAICTWMDMPTVLPSEKTTSAGAADLRIPHVCMNH